MHVYAGGVRGEREDAGSWDEDDDDDFGPSPNLRGARIPAAAGNNWPPPLPPSPRETADVSCSRRHQVHQVPTLSELSSQSSDEDRRVSQRRAAWRRDGDHVFQVSSLTTSHSASHCSEHQLTASDSSSENTTDRELQGVVPDPETLKQVFLSRANKTPAKVPKMPSHLKKQMVRCSHWIIALIFVCMYACVIGRIIQGM